MVVDRGVRRGVRGGQRDLILGDDALLYITYLKLHLVAGIRGALISITGLVLSALSL